MHIKEYCRLNSSPSSQSPPTPPPNTRNVTFAVSESISLDDVQNNDMGALPPSRPRPHSIVRRKSNQEFVSKLQELQSTLDRHSYANQQYSNKWLVSHNNKCSIYND